MHTRRYNTMRGQNCNSISLRILKLSLNTIKNFYAYLIFTS